MKQILLLFFILLLSVSIDEIKEDSKLDVIINSEDMDDFLANVAFWLNNDNDEFKKAYKESTEKDSFSTPTQPSEITSQTETSNKAELSEDQTLKNQSVLLAFNEKNKQSENNKTPSTTSQETSEVLPSKIIENESEEIILEEKIVEQKTTPEENAIITNSSTEKQSLENIETKEDEISPIVTPEEIKEEIEVPIEILSKKKYLEDIFFENINIDKVQITDRPNSYKVDFTLINLAEVQQSGIIEFSLEFEDGTIIPFTSIRGSYRFRHQVAKKYVVTKGEDIKQYNKVSKPYSFVIGFFHEGVLIKRNKFLLSK